MEISEKRYNKLIDDSRQLAHLEALGVDNWEGYSYWNDEDEDDEDDEDEI